MTVPTVFSNYSVRELILMVDNKREATLMERELAARLQATLMEHELADVLQAVLDSATTQKQMELSNGDDWE